ncbi:MAG: L-seryl-tRNA(Sec) selenium transferase [Desulfovibrionales bacterium]|nr:L-seryl-tRNA(Sec) selenium transferase [Desulfovibrionales bacterium]
MSSLFRYIPSVDRFLQTLEAEDAFAPVPRPELRVQVGAFLDLCREEIREGVLTTPEDLAWERLVLRARAFVRTAVRPHFRRVINATGVVIHTNLGRSILADQAVQAVVDGCRHYSNLEMNLATGQRGSRYAHVEALLCRLTGAEAGLVVNNNAAAVLLVLDTLAKEREVVVSRGQLVEIGGSFRIPEVMKKSGAVLREVGATNRTHLHDYAQAITERTALLMKVHTSNYRIIGFHKEVSAPDLVALGAEHGLPVFEDLGSGNLFDFSPYHFMSEPTVQQVVRAGVQVVSFSGDKLLGGPQAGIIVGHKKYIDQIKKNQLNRALRIDKMTLAALEATLRLYVDPETARQAVPTVRMITAPKQEIQHKAQALQRKLRATLGDLAEIACAPGQSRVGGGSFPEQDVPTVLVRIYPRVRSVEALRDGLLQTDPPVIGRVEDGALCCDPRTIEPGEYGLIAAAMLSVLTRQNS